MTTETATPLPWLAEPLAQALEQQRGHAVLVHGSAGVGSMEFSLLLAQAWLCEQTPEAAKTGPCLRCASCRLVQSKLHPDLFVLMPEALRKNQGWLLVDDKAEGADSKRKPSQQIRIVEVRALIDWSQKTNARGRGKVAVLHPADALNLQSASALLKTLEEPAPGTRLILTTADPARLLPTVLSRCQRVLLPAPDSAEALAWLAGQGVAQPEVLLAACCGRPLEALTLSQSGVHANVWASLPRAVAQGAGAAALTGWPVPVVVDALHKLCHDALACSVGGSARYFPNGAVPRTAALPALLAWAQTLARVGRHAEHPWSEALLLDSLLGQGQQALADATLPPARRSHATANLASPASTLRGLPPATPSVH